jgi:hypothetical protein
MFNKDKDLTLTHADREMCLQLCAVSMDNRERLSADYVPPVLILTILLTPRVCSQSELDS